MVMASPAQIVWVVPSAKEGNALTSITKVELAPSQLSLIPLTVMFLLPVLAFESILNRIVRWLVAPTGVKPVYPSH